MRHFKLFSNTVTIFINGRLVPVIFNASLEAIGKNQFHFVTQEAGKEMMMLLFTPKTNGLAQPRFLSGRKVVLGSSRGEKIHLQARVKGDEY